MATTSVLLPNSTTKPKVTYAGSTLTIEAMQNIVATLEKQNVPEDERFIVVSQNQYFRVIRDYLIENRDKFSPAAHAKGFTFLGVPFKVHW